MCACLCPCVLEKSYRWLFVTSLASGVVKRLHVTKPAAHHAPPGIAARFSTTCTTRSYATIAYYAFKFTNRVGMQAAFKYFFHAPSWGRPELAKLLVWGEHTGTVEDFTAMVKSGKKGDCKENDRHAAKKRALGANFKDASDPQKTFSCDKCRVIRNTCGIDNGDGSDTVTVGNSQCAVYCDPMVGDYENAMKMLKPHAGYVDDLSKNEPWSTCTDKAFCKRAWEEIRAKYGTWTETLSRDPLVKTFLQTDAGKDLQFPCVGVKFSCTVLRQSSHDPRAPAAHPSLEPAPNPQDT